MTPSQWHNSLPLGFSAQCQCSSFVNALNSKIARSRTDTEEASKVLGYWLHLGYAVVPYFDSANVQLSLCTCGSVQDNQAKQNAPKSE